MMAKTIFLLFLVAICITPVVANVNSHNESLQLLMHMNGADGGTVVTDEVGNSIGRTNAVTKTNEKYLGNASMYFDGTGDYLWANSSSYYALGTNNFTLSFFFNTSALPANARFLTDYRPNTADGVYPTLYIFNNNISYYVSSANKITSGNILEANKWYHVALIRNNSETKLYINGVQNGSTYSDTNDYLVGSGSKPRIGESGKAVANAFQGYIDEYALWNGAALPIEDLYPMTDEIWNGSPTNPPVFYYAYGDSITRATTAGGDLASDGSDSFVIQMRDNHNATAGADHNIAPASHTSTQALANISANYNQENEVYIIEFGVNDASTGISDWNQTAQNLIDMVDYAEGNGSRVMVSMILNRSAVDEGPRITAVQNYLTEHDTCYVRTWDSLDSVPYNEVLDPYDDTYFIDGVHPNKTGQYLMSEYVWGVLNGSVDEVCYVEPPEIVSSFSPSINPATTNTAVVFTDTSSGTPTTWNWTIAGSVTNTTQNATYSFASQGTYAIDLNVTNATGYFSNYTLNYLVSNVTGLTHQDVFMESQKTLTLNFKSSTNGELIPVVQVYNQVDATTVNTTNGTFIGTYSFGTQAFIFHSEGYASRVGSYYVDDNVEYTVQMVPSSASSTPQQSVWYTPWQVRIRIVDYYGIPLPGTNVTANYIAATLPSTDPTWLVGAFGVNEDVAADMINSSVAMIGDTDDNGGLSFTMFKSLQYRLTITNTTSSVSSTKTLYPSDQEYVIYVRTAGQGLANNTLAMRNGTLPWYSVNSTHINLNMTYVDTSLCTSNLVFRVWFRDNNTEVHNTTWSGIGAGYVYDNHTVPKAPIGTEYLWGYNATTVC